MEKILQKIEELLKNANFEIFSFNFDSTRQNYCYDFIVKKNDLVFIVKAFSNIDNIDIDMLKGIKILSKILKSKPLLIGIKNRYQKLEDNTIYLREDLPFITIDTLENILKYQLFPFILARRGGGVVFLDGEIMKEVREEQKISRKELSERIGVTKRTICSYESENMRPSMEVAEKLEAVLGTDAFLRNINVLDWRFKFNFNEEGVEKDQELNPFEEHIQNVIRDIGIRSYFYKKGRFPFEMLISSKDLELECDNNFYPLFSEISYIKEHLRKINLSYLRIFAKLFHKHSLWIIKDDIKIPQLLKKEQIPVIKIKKLEKIDDENEFIEFIQGSEKPASSNQS
ncbi:MAG: putative HTH-type transcriptional regulatory protein [Promethearchaeota archaeon]|nr:MAG: putative HTH-type transcriptional regulatory protein [Candidatus Lokiarchaeota archaeon]